LVRSGIGITIFAGGERSVGNVVRQHHVRRAPLMLALIPAALERRRSRSLSLVTAVCCVLIAWDVIR
jgi:hypothetical protein